MWYATVKIKDKGRSWKGLWTSSGIDPHYPQSQSCFLCKQLLLKQIPLLPHLAATGVILFNTTKGKGIHQENESCTIYLVRICSTYGVWNKNWCRVMLSPKRFWVSGPPFKIKSHKLCHRKAWVSLPLRAPGIVIQKKKITSTRCTCSGQIYGTIILVYLWILP